MKRVIVAGGSGFIGGKLCSLLSASGYEVAILSRSPSKSRERFGRGYTILGWDGKSARGWGDMVNGAFAVINLAGENIASGRWTASRRERIVHSRLNAGRAVVKAFEAAEVKPKVLVQASAVGWYGDMAEPGDESAPQGKGFLADLSGRWEKSTEAVEAMGVRRVIVRTGVVLGKGGALAKMATPFKFFLGGPVGGGTQGVSWIHIDDEVGAIKHLLETESAQGVYNLTAPNPVDNKEFSAVLGSVLHRPSGLALPAFAARLMFGLMADEILLSGQFAKPGRLLASGYTFNFQDVERAMADILGG